MCEKSSVERNVERYCISKKEDAAEAALETREWLPVLFRRRRTPEMMDTSFEEVLEKASRVTHYTSNVIGCTCVSFSIMRRAVCTSPLRQNVMSHPPHVTRRTHLNLVTDGELPPNIMSPWTCSLLPKLPALPALPAVFGRFSSRMLLYLAETLVTCHTSHALHVTRTGYPNNFPGDLPHHLRRSCKIASQYILSTNLNPKPRTNPIATHHMHRFKRMARKLTWSRHRSRLLT